MTVGSLGLYRPDGRLRGVHVYMLLCRDDGPVYVKVGISKSPTDRLMALRSGCAVTPRQFFSFEVRSKGKALGIERDLHRAFYRWLAQGEWFRVPIAERAEFNAAWQPVVDRHRESGWPCRWERVSVSAFMADAHRRRDAALARQRNAPRARRDAIADGLRNWRQ